MRRNDTQTYFYLLYCTYEQHSDSTMATVAVTGALRLSVACAEPRTAWLSCESLRA
jgi:hypothetical protein